MEFMNRSGQSRPANTSTAAAVPSPAKVNNPTSDGLLGRNATDATHSKWFRWGFLILLFSATALFVAMLFFIVFGAPVAHENKYVNKNEYQAVFVNVNGTNGGQVYFGHVQDLTPQFIRLTDVFYIQNQASGQDQASAYNLVKLGCELHGPEDQMLINRSEVFFWENLKSDSQVAQKAAEFHKQNPDGQKCSSTTNSTQQSSGTTNVAPGTGGTTTTPAAGSTTTTPSTNTTTPTTTPSTGTGTVKKP